MSFLSNAPLLSGRVQRSYATLSSATKSAHHILSNGNLTYASANGQLQGISISTVGKSSGKWYWELTLNSFVGSSGSSTNLAGISSIVPPFGNGTGYWLGVTSGTVSIRPNTYSSAYWSYFGSGISPNQSGSWATDYAVGSILSFALDLQSLTFQIYLNGVSIGTAVSIPAGTYYASVGTDGQGVNGTLNFGQNAWSTNITVETTRNSLFASGFNQGLYS